MERAAAVVARPRSQVGEAWAMLGGGRPRFGTRLLPVGGGREGKSGEEVGGQRTGGGGRVSE